MNSDPLKSPVADESASLGDIPLGLQSNELGFIELLIAIRRRIKLVFLSVLVSVGLAITYLFLAEPAYRSETHLFPPQQQDIQGLSVRLSSMEEEVESSRYSSAQIYKRMLRNLNSQGLRREFFDKHDLVVFYVSGKRGEQVNTEEVFDQKFNRSFQVHSDVSDPSVVVASFSYSNPELAAKWLNQFVEFANKRTIHQLGGDVDVEVKAEINWVRNNLSSMLASAQKRRQDRIIRLKEALQVAKTLGITDTSTLSVVSGSVSQGGVAVNTAQLPLYMRGVKALDEEIAVLQSRELDEAFIEGYRDLQARLNMLETISLDLGALSAVNVDMPARAAYCPDKPKKPLILLLAVALGILIGVVLASFAEFWSKR